MKNFSVFNIDVKDSAKVLFVTDAHMGAGYGTYKHFDKEGNVTENIDSFGRIEIMADRINRESDFCHVDAVLCLGDMVSNEYNAEDKTENDISSYADKYTGTRFSEREQFLIEVGKGRKDLYFVSDTRENPYFMRFVKDYMCKVKLPVFYCYANHDDIFDDEWEKLLGYGKNYIIHFGNILSVIVADNYHEQQDSKTEQVWGYGGKATDISEEFYEFVKEEIRERKNVILASHFPEDEAMPLLSKLVRENDNIICSMCGHTHGIKQGEFGGKPRFESGHFSYCDSWDKVDEKNAAENKGVWGFRYFDIGEKNIETYMVYPEVNYGLNEREEKQFYQKRFSTKNTLHKGYVNLSDLIQKK